MGELPKSIAELSSEGYCEPSRALNWYLNQYPEIRSNLVRFSSGVGGSNAHKGSIKYSNFDLFNKQSMVYYIIDCEEAKRSFSEFLVSLFLKANPNPDKNLRKAFTKILHQYDLHWEKCYHLIKIRNQ